MNPEKIHKEDFDQLLRKQKELEKRLQEVEQIARLGHWELDIVNNRLYWSDEIYRILKMKRGSFEPVYETYLDMVHPDERKQVDEKYRKSIKDRKPFDDIHRVVLGDESIKHLHVKCKSEYRNGKAIRSIGTIQDITDRCIAEKQLKESEARLASTMNSIDDLVFVIDKDGKFAEYYNPRETSYLYVPETEFLNKHYKDVKLPEELIKQMDKAFQEIQKEMSTTEFDYSLMLENQKLWFNAKLSPQMDEKNRFMGITVVAREITKRKKAEEDLKLSEYFLNESQKVARLGYYIMDVKKNRWFSSAILDDIFGIDEHFPRDTESWINILHPDHKEEMLRHINEEVFGKHQPFDKESKIISYNDKQEKWVHALGKLEFDENHVPVRMIGTIQDITERKKAEDALKQSEDRLSKIMLAANDGYWDWDLQTNAVYFDPKYYTMAGYQVNEFPHRLEEFQKRVHPDDIDYVMEIAGKHIAGEIERFIVEFRFRKRDDSWLWILGTGIIVERDESNTPIRFIGTHKDITERKKAEAEILETNAKLKAMINNTDEFIMIADKKGFPVMYNESYKNRVESILGIPIKPGIKPHTLLNDEVQNAFWDELHNRVLSGEKFKQLFEFPVNDVMRYFEFSFYPIIENGEVFGFVEHSRDITEQKENENILKRAKEKAEESDRLKSSFLANLSHEIRTPMNGIIGFSELIKKPDLDENKRNQYANIIIENSHHLLNVVNDILDISIIETGQLTIKNEQFHLNELFKETFEFFEQEARQNVLKFSYNTGLENPNDIIISDKQRVRQILNNLLSNAFKYTDKGEIEFGYHKKDQQVEVYVKDTGCGIKNEHQDKVFERFSRTDNELTNSKGGTGLGLAISKGILEQLGGDIWFNSVVGQGSVFFFSIPLNPQD